MPLVTYFGTIGAILTVLMLLVNVLLDPGHDRSNPESAPAETNLPKPRATAPVAQYTPGVTRIAPSEDVQGGRLSLAAPPTAASAEPQQQQSESEVERTSLQRRKPDGRTAKIRTKGRNANVAGRHSGRKTAYSDLSPGYYSPGFHSYARERPAWPFPIRDSLDPH
jgi:hypothetical protein